MIYHEFIKPAILNRPRRSEQCIASSLLLTIEGDARARLRFLARRNVSRWLEIS